MAVKIERLNRQELDYFIRFYRRSSKEFDGDGHLILRIVKSFARNKLNLGESGSLRTWGKSDFLAKMKINRDFLWIAKEKGNIIGYLGAAYLRPKPPVTVEIYHSFISNRSDTEWVRKKLIKAFVDACIRRKYSEIWTRPPSSQRKTYRSLGFGGSKTLILKIKD
jgi:hypothetical protein